MVISLLITIQLSSQWLVFANAGKSVVGRFQGQAPVFVAATRQERRTLKANNSAALFRDAATVAIHSCFGYWALFFDLWLPRPTNSQFVRRWHNYRTPFYLKNCLRRQFIPQEAVGTLFAYLRKRQ